MRRIHRWCWISLTNGQWCDKAFHVMPSSWYFLVLCIMYLGPTWCSPGSCRPQMGPILAPWILLSGVVYVSVIYSKPYSYKLLINSLYLMWISSQIICARSLLIWLFHLSFLSHALSTHTSPTWPQAWQVRNQRPMGLK